MLSDVRAIAFDLDNTLWDLDPVLVRGLVLAENGSKNSIGDPCPLREPATELKHENVDE